MEDIIRRVTVQSQGAENVLVIELEEGEQLIPYCCKMMESRSIPGLLQMRHQWVDGITYLYYPIGGRVPLGDFMLRQRPPYWQGLMLLRNLCQALLRLDEYFLSVEMCYLDGLQVFLPCVPLEQQEGMPSGGPARLKRFFQQLLGEYFAVDDCTSYDAMFKWVHKPVGFDLQTFYNQFLVEPELPVAKEVSAAVPPPPAAVPPQPQPESIASVPVPGERPEDGPSTPKEEKKLPVRILPFLKRKSSTGQEPLAPGQGGESSGLVGKEKRNRSDGKLGKKKSPQSKPSFEVPGGIPKEDIAAPPATPPAFAGGAVPQQGDSIFVATPPQPAAHRPADRLPAAYLIHRGRHVPISRSPFLMGKLNSSIQLDYAIEGNNRVSRSHATILFVGEQYQIRDNQSRNGTSLNGRLLLPLQPAPLADGDEIKLFDEILVFHLE